MTGPKDVTRPKVLNQGRRKVSTVGTDIIETLRVGKRQPKCGWKREGEKQSEAQRQRDGECEIDRERHIYIKRKSKWLKERTLGER